jgi:ribosomal protein S18 acetylase RimI-like enzyme
VSEPLRAPTDDDVAEVVRLMSEHSPEPADEDFVRSRWSSPTFELERDARIEAGAYADVHALGNERVWIDVRGSPSPTLLDWAETRAQELGRRLFAGAWETNETLRSELDRRGFRVVRYSYRMRSELDETTPEPTWPDGIHVRRLRPGDERTFYEVQQEVFADTWEPVEETFEEWSHHLMNSSWFDPQLWFLALEDSDPAGLAICRVHQGESDLGWVQILGVRRPWRGRGLGRALLLSAFVEFRRRDLRFAGLGVDAESPTGAVQLYESVAMGVVGRFELREKVVA